MIKEAHLSIFKRNEISNSVISNLGISNQNLSVQQFRVRRSIEVFGYFI